MGDRARTNHEDHAGHRLGTGRAEERDACGVGFIADARGRASHEIVELALEALVAMRHRGAVAADTATSDGAGLLVPIPRRLLGAELARAGPDPERVGLISLFVTPGDEDRARSLVEGACAEEGLPVYRWRDVPVATEVLGPHARATAPICLQAIVDPTPRVTAGGHHPDRRAHRARRRIEAAVRRESVGLYVVSASCSTVTYKALVAPGDLASFYPDLRDERTAASFAILHQRYATNTSPTWSRAQPFRLLCHNGEINTIEGNVRHMRARQMRLGAASPTDEELFRPVLDPAGSDSAMLDEVVELLTREGDGGAGLDTRHAVTMLVPPVWEDAAELDDAERSLHRAHASRTEPWDGPAALVWTDGVGVGAALDRNGLRPMRVAVCADGLVVCASEAGVVDTTGRGGVRRGKLGPGRMIWVDPREGGVQHDPVRRIAHRIAAQGPVGAAAPRRAAHRRPSAVPGDLIRRQVLHGVTREEVRLILRAAAATGREPTFSMGDDTPIAVLSARERPMHHHLRQRFAQVTNPPIDHVRERHVMSTRTLLGPRVPLLAAEPAATQLVEESTFILTSAPAPPAGSSPAGSPPAHPTLDATWPATQGPAGMRAAMDRIDAEVVLAATLGAPIVVISDAAAGPERAPVPSLLAVGSAHRALVSAGVRSLTSIVAEADDVRESHHVAALLAFGADAVVPRLALATAASLARDGGLGGVPMAEALANLRDALEEGVLKVMAKLGIAVIDAYRGAEAFDVLGLAQEVSDRCFGGVASALEGVGFDDLARRALGRHQRAFRADAPSLDDPGYVKFRRGGEYHANEPSVARRLHRTVDPALARLRSTAAASGDDEDRAGESPAADAGLLQAAHALRGAVVQPGRSDLYARFTELVHARPPTAPRDLLEAVTAAEPISIELVEPAESILRRFSSGGISHGSVSREAHETIAIAMHMVGGRANSGEGGEDPARFRTDRNCGIKQVASARFGVTPEYCAFADELQIKIAQGAKPGEGGQLPGHKATEEIARLRHTRPGVELISPAPHHDIYSIEDIAQLIFDLRQVGPSAAVSVKLVAERGVGTVAAGVVKGFADVVHIAGADGGTGASPLASIKHAGLPWELGLAEVRQVLSAEGLRDRVRLRVDGGLKTGRDVVVAALLGADEFSFGTALLLAEGCIMVRTCHLDTCPVGIATQRPELRSRFAGTPEMVATYLRHVAEEVRSILARMGLRSLDEAIGRVELLRERDAEGPAPPVDLSQLLARPKGARRFDGSTPDRRLRSQLGDRLHADAWPTVRDGGTLALRYPISTADRAIGARLGGAIGAAVGRAHPKGTAHATFDGAAGQSFGAFLAAGVQLDLVGEANDYVGKGMGGGRIVIVPPPDDAGDPVLVGNTALYGATGGELFVAGRAGERFAVRNSGALAVIEGAGEHCCEYMTGGAVVVLGTVGTNLGAGMTGGEAFVLADDGRLESRLNRGTVEALPLGGDASTRLRGLLESHLRYTSSVAAARELAAWPASAGRWRHVMPRTDGGPDGADRPAGSGAVSLSPAPP